MSIIFQYTNLLKFTAVLMLIFSISSCKSKKVLTAKERTNEEIYNALETRNIDFKWFGGKASISMESPEESMSGSVHVRMKRDSAIWMSIRKLGIEFAKVYIDPKEYTTLYKFEGLYEQNSLDEVSQIMGIAGDFIDIQHLMFGNIILPDRKNTTINKSGYLYEIQGNVGSFYIHYFIDSNTLNLMEVHIKDSQGRQANISYDDYKLVQPNMNAAYKRKINFPINDKGQTAFLELEFSDITIDKTLDISFSIPQKYTRL